MFRRKRLTLQHKVRTATLLLKAGWVGVIYAELDKPEISWQCKHHHRYPDIAYHCAAKQLRREQKETSA